MPARAATALIATVVSLVLLFNFKTPSLNSSRPGSAGVTGPLPPASAAPPTPTPAQSPGDSAAPPSPSPTPSGPALHDGTYTGTDFPNEFGDVQVSVTISGGRITDVQGVQMPMDRQRSALISQYAGPQLRSEVLQAQSAQIDSISGATYTSDSYAQSVQSALDQATH
jgi:uncharacterized protein with FMN-binding domain